MRILLVGPPGAGKGTQAALLAKNLGIPHISTGDLFRANISEGTELGRRAQDFMRKGELVPDEITIGMAKDRMEQPDAANGFLLDGFPRNLAQAEALDGILTDVGLALDSVLDLEVPEDEVVRRIAGRRMCRQDSSHIFHVDYTPPKAEGVCDVCGGELYQRDDDREDTVRKRLEVYHSETEPIIDYYKAQGLVTTLSALG
ncbi:adenylate kinase, partial [Streptomyces chumphonensis]